MIRETIKQALVAAMKGGDTARRDTIRLIQAQLKNRDIELRGAANPPEDDVLAKQQLAHEEGVSDRIEDEGELKQR